MVDVFNYGTFIKNNSKVKESNTSIEDAKKNTLAYRILKAHNQSKDMDNLELKFDALTSPDNNYASIIQTAVASGLKKFPIPYVLTNCHNSLCAVGGTINEDDHEFGKSAAVKFGGYFVPPHFGVIHQYMRENFAGCGKMILGSDSHTRYGALGTLSIGEGGGEVVKQLLNKTYNITYPNVIGIKLSGTLREGVGPMDVALAFIREVYEKEIVKNSILEFFGEGISSLDVETRNGIDVMSSETNCLSTIWETDELVEEFLTIHNRKNDYKKLELNLEEEVYYDKLVEINLSTVEPMIALPSHPSNAYTIRELNENLDEICELTNKKLKDLGVNFDIKTKIKDGKLFAEQGVIGGCSGGIYNNISTATKILEDKGVGEHFTLNIYPASQNTYMTLLSNGEIGKLNTSGAIVRSAICGPCFGVGDIPGNNQLSIRHNTRNFPNREGAKKSNNQVATVALMDARSIAASALNDGIITSALDLNKEIKPNKYEFDEKIYSRKVFNYGKLEDRFSDFSHELVEGPNIKPWPELSPLPENLLLKVTAFITDPVTTTDELMPSGDASSYRSNPEKLSEFTLVSRVPNYVNDCREVRAMEIAKKEGNIDSIIQSIFDTLNNNNIKTNPKELEIGTLMYAFKPGDGSAREQAASNQKILAGWGNIAKEYATKRYKTNLINWGIIPFILKENPKFKEGDYIYFQGIKEALTSNKNSIKAVIIKENSTIEEETILIDTLDDTSKQILIDGGLINYYKKNNKGA